jgi:hypothetical protein
MSDDKKINVLYGYSKLKEAIPNAWAGYFAKDCLKIVYELGDPQDFGDNVRVLRVQNGKSTVTDAVGYDTKKQQADGFVQIGQEKLGTERDAALALDGFSHSDVGASDNFSDSFGKQNCFNSGILDVSSCMASMRYEIAKAEKINKVLDTFSAEELRKIADIKGKDCR